MAKRHNREDFSAKVKQILRERVANTCSREGCGVSTIGPGAEPDKVVRIGVAAHIHAASPRGPRANPALSKEQRTSLENGIWLCTSCSVLIDQDPARYPPELLHKWRQNREAEVRFGLNQRPGFEEGKIQMMQALTGLPGLKTSTSLIQNSHGAVAASLEKLDMRINVETKYENGVTHINLRAREKVDFAFHVPASKSQAWNLALKQVQQYGTAQLNLDGVSVSGSELIAHLAKEAKTMEISLPKKKAVVRLEMVHNEKTNHQFAQIEGELSGGSSEVSFNGFGFENILQIKIKFPLEKQNTKKPTLNFSIDLKEWEGSELRHIPFTRKIAAFYRDLLDNYQIRLILEIGGEEVYTSTSNTPLGSIFDSLDMYRYLDAARDLSLIAATPVYFFSGHKVTRKEFRETLEAKDQYDTKNEIYGKNFTQKITVITESEIYDKYRDGNNINHQNVIQIQEHVQRKLRIFGREIALPFRTWYFPNVRLVQTDESSANKKTREIEVQCDPETRVTMVLDAPSLDA